MGTIDLRAAVDGNLIADLSSQVHQLPCCIRFDGPAEVSHYFKPNSSEVEVDGVRTKEAHFRGRKLQGATISLPIGYSGFVLQQASNLNANGKRKASSITDENTCWEAKAKFDNLTYWNHDNLPSKDDTFVRSFHWYNIADALHKPVKVEDLVAAVSHGGKDQL
ncbi:PREDICTED: ribonuclease H2 subunit C-like [Camelina sativa]|uniref:Ribonuclease H2 subunit C-like n=1 Tax=Camelina sativa TaxID=90675 RepID=A0ABM0ZL68_CAMSA|nr:PREDICTED: ribonuclease H2 subunit C-like [Camelina sativa]